MGLILVIPDKQKHNPSPDYLRALIDKIKRVTPDISIGKVADNLGIDRSQFRAYLVHDTKSSYRVCPYTTQYALEQWATQKVKKLNNYMNISDEAQLLLSEIADSFGDNDDEATVLTICQVEALGDHAGLQNNYVNAAVQELAKAQIVKIASTGKFLILDSCHISEFQSQFSLEVSA